MLQNEFEERIGRKVSEDEYVEANAMYELAGDSVDKDVFCREWLKIGESPLVRGLYETAYQKGQDLQEHKLMLNECREIISDTADAMLDIEKMILDGGTAGHTVPASDLAGMVVAELERKIWWLIGQKKTVLLKLAKGIALSEDDVEYISNNLK